MERTRKMLPDGRELTTNFMLDEIIDIFEKYGIDNDEMIKELAIQKIEYGRKCFAQMRVKGNQTLESNKKMQADVDKTLCELIVGLGGMARERTFVEKE